MLKAWKRFGLMLRLVSVAIILGLLAVIGYQLVDFYEDKVGFTPNRAIEAYFTHLAQGNFDEVYALTDKEHLTDIYGRPVTEEEFIRQLEGLTGERRMPFQSITVTRLLERQGVRYYEVELHSVVSGRSGTSHVVVEVRRQGGAWVVSYPFAIVL
jgi:hypothetical protein